MDQQPIDASCIQVFNALLKKDPAQGFWSLSLRRGSDARYPEGVPLQFCRLHPD